MSIWIQASAPPEGFTPYQRVEQKEWARADRDGLPCLLLERRYDGEYEAVCFVAYREAP